MNFASIAVNSQETKSPPAWVEVSSQTGISFNPTTAILIRLWPSISMQHLQTKHYLRIHVITVQKREMERVTSHGIIKLEKGILPVVPVFFSFLLRFDERRALVCFG